MGATYLINNEAKPTTLAVIGVSAMFTPKLLKILGLGADKADTIRQKIAFLAFTRNAFDELESRSQEIREIFASDSVFLDTLKSLRAEFQSSPLSDSAYSMRI
ncbi:MAG: hypothetical protein KDC45_15970, partial [Bacteroidetes bacterium]|nr:hypothetical protein [Bacteroidota bacterium]